MPTIGDTSFCKHCGEPIAWMGSSWGHFGDVQPKHPAAPHDPITVTTSDGYIVKTSDKRVLACVNACAGIADPSAIPDLISLAEGLHVYIDDDRAAIRLAKVLDKLKGGV